MDDITTAKSTLEAAHRYIARGWKPIPIPTREKGPVIKGWQILKLTADDLPKYFATNGNIGLVLGEVSGGLVDVDLDAMDAIRAAHAFLPYTGMVHGRKNKASSHRWYVAATSIPKSERFSATDGKCIVEIRSTGGQTIVPPSIHPSGEAIVWEKNGTPAPVDGENLRTSVAYLAASV